MATTSVPIVDAEGFQLVTSRKVPTVTATEPPISAVFLNTSNGFEILATHTFEDECDIPETML